MGRSNIDRAKDARECFREAEEAAEEAKDLFKKIGDPDGERIAEDIEERSKRGKEYVDKRVGKDR